VVERVLWIAGCVVLPVVWGVVVHRLFEWLRPRSGTGDDRDFLDYQI
jgi:hypothetical protein